MKKILVPILAVLCFVASLRAQTVSTVVSDDTDEPYAVAVDNRFNDYWFTDSANNRVLAYDTAFDLLFLIVDGTQISGDLLSPSGIVPAPTGPANGFVVADTGHHVLRLVKVDGSVVTIAGTLGVPGNANGAAASATFNSPAGIALDNTDGTIYIADTLNNAIRSLDTANQVRTVATGFNKPAGVAVGRHFVAGTTNTVELWVADTLNDVIQYVTIARAPTSTNINSSIIAGKFRVPGSLNSVNSTNATFNQPRALTWVGGSTGLLISDSANNEIRELYYDDVRKSWGVTTYAGSTTAGLVNGSTTAARFNSPVGLALDTEGSVIIADLKNDSLREIARTQMPTPETFLSTGPAVSGGAFSNAIDVVFDDLFAGANTTFRYTLDGTAPTGTSASGTDVILNGGLLGGAVSNAVPLEVKAYDPDFNASPVLSNYYTFFVAQPLTFPAGITNDNDSILVISNVTFGASLRYTIDGSEPTLGSFAVPTNNASFNTIVISNNHLKIKGFKNGYADSVTETFTFNLSVGDPVIILPGATNNNDVQFLITTTTIGANLYWTINGDDPTANHPSTSFLVPPSGLITVTNNGTLKVRGFKDGYNPSAVISAGVSLTAATPTISVTPNPTNNNTVKITARTATTNAYLVYTTDGTDPTSTIFGVNGTLVNATNLSLVDFAQDCTLKVRAFRSGYVDSAVASQVIHLFVSDPIITPAGATNINNVAFFIADATSNLTVYTTLDGTDPAPGSPSSTLVTMTDNTAGFFTSRIVVSQNGTLKVRGFRAGFAPSAVVSVTVNLRVGTPTITAVPSLTNNNDIVVSISTLTTNSNTKIVVTTDGSDPVFGQFQTNGYVLSGPSTSFALTTNGTGTIKAGAFLTGYQDSVIASTGVNLFVSNPGMSPSGTTNINDVYVTVTEATTNGEVYWTMTGNDPVRGNIAPTNNAVTGLTPSTPGTIQVSSNGVLKLKGFRDGYTSSSVISGSFVLNCDTPRLIPGPGTNINTVSVTVTNSTTNLNQKFYYTLDGSVPTTNSSFTVNGHVFVFTTNTTLSVVATLSGYNNSPTVSSNYFIQVDAPVMSPSGGYFPSGSTVTLTVNRTNLVTYNNNISTIYYTTDGSVPTTSSLKYTGPFQVDQVFFPNTDLRIIRARAFATNCIASDIAQGQSFATNQVGVPADLIAGSGSTIVIPVIANLSSNQDLRSLQFRFEITPNGGAPIMTHDIRGLNVGTNDFVPVVANFDGSANTFTVTPYHTGPSGVTNGVTYASIATNNLFIRNFGLIMNVAVDIPTTCTNGQTYQVRVLEVSGTSDGAQAAIPLTPMTNRTITVTTKAYVVGDCSPGRWYNAGDFGDNQLNNADVNTVFRASLGRGTPYPNTDAFNAMDSFPLDSPGVTGGDGFIRFLDWNTLLDRSLRNRSDNWTRFWTNNGSGGALLNSSYTLPASSRPVHKSSPPPGLVWMRHAQIGAGSVANALAGGTYNVPVYANVLPGYSVAGLQFRATLHAEGLAPAVAQSLNFITPTGMLPPTYKENSGSDLLCAWSLTNSFSPSLEGSNFLGYIQCTLPGGAQSGQHYTLHFSYADGAPDVSTQYDFESFASDFWVQTSGQTLPAVSDEWKIKFFGSVSSLNANPLADPDHDGVPNWKEFLAGTDPTSAGSRLQFSSTALVNSGNTQTVAIRWLSAPGKSYVVESSPAVNGTWTAAGTVAGDGYVQEVDVTNVAGQAQFYRLRLQP